jgi:DNA-binding transcriptional ArsR family regulator
VSHHLGVLRSSGVVKDKKVGRFVYYMLNPDLVSKSGGALHFRLAGATLTIG